MQCFVSSKVSTHVQASFQRNYNDNLMRGWSSLLGYCTTMYGNGGSPKGRLFCWSMCRLNPNDPRFSYPAARAFIAGDQPQAAQYYIELGMKLPHHDDCNFIFQLGRVAPSRPTELFDTIHKHKNTLFSLHCSII